MLTILKGVRNLRLLVDKLINKDKDYNKYILKIDNLLKRIYNLRNENKELVEKKNTIKFQGKLFKLTTYKIINKILTINLVSPEIILHDEDKNIVKSEHKPDKAEALLIKEEEKLNAELQDLQTKYEDITLIYDRIKANISNLIHSEIKEAQAQKYEDELLDNSTNANNENQDTRNDTTIKTTITSEKENQVIPHTKIDDEDEFILTYFDFLKRTKKD